MKGIITILLLITLISHCFTSICEVSTGLAIRCANARKNPYCRELKGFLYINCECGCR